jgi:hypothetical protein
MINQFLQIKQKKYKSCQKAKSTSILADYIFQNEKSRSSKMDLLLLKKRYHTNFEGLIFTILQQIHGMWAGCRFVGDI